VLIEGYLMRYRKLMIIKLDGCLCVCVVSIANSILDTVPNYSTVSICNDVSCQPFPNVVTLAKPNLTNVLSRRTSRRSSEVVAFCRGGPRKLELRKFPWERKASGSRMISWNLKKMVVDDSQRRKSGKRLNNDFNGAAVLPPLLGHPSAAPFPSHFPSHFLILSCLPASSFSLVLGI